MLLRNITFGLLDQWIEFEVPPRVEKQIQKQDQTDFQQSKTGPATDWFSFDSFSIVLVKLKSNPSS